MDRILENQELLIRVGFFVVFVILLATAEMLVPRRPLTDSKMRRWGRNMGIALLDTVIIRIMFPVAAIGSAVWAAENGYGLFNILDVPFWVAAVVPIVILDFAIYLQHLVFHRVELLWRLHQVHHSDLDLDFTSAVRFHPIEIVLSMLIKMGLVIALGAHPGAVLVFELILFGLAAFNHANIRIPLALDAVIRMLVVTPDMHRVHHSTISKECHSNFGFNLSIWDRMLRTYTAQPAKGHDGMEIGLGAVRDPEKVTFGKMLVAPFMKLPG